MKYIYFFILSLLTIQLVAADISNLSFSSTTIDQYQKLEATFTLTNNTYTNPYDLDQVQVIAEITSPDNSIFEYPCFYYIPGTVTSNNVTLDLANATWMLRFTPKDAGSYSVRIKATEGTIVNYSTPITLTVNSGNGKGFIHLDQTNPQFYRHNDGTPYYPNGINLGWSNNSYGTFYPSYTSKMSDNGMNWMRVWMTHYARQSILWSDQSGEWWDSWYNDPIDATANSDLKHYSAKGAMLIEHMIQEAESKNLYVQLCFQHHGQFSSTTNSDWAHNPFNNTQPNGILNNAGDFFTDTNAKAITKNLYTYIIARWGYSPNIFAWELFNEVEFTDGADTDIDNWHDEMSLYIESIDYHDHIITTSSGGDDSTFPLMDDNSAIDVLQYHTYNTRPEQATLALAEELSHVTSKPLLGGEFGADISNAAYDPHPDTDADHLRKTIWMGMMQETPQMFWYWDYYIDNENLYNVYTPLAEYLTNEDIVASTTGNHHTFTLQNNPFEVANLTFTPSAGWQDPYVGQNTFIVDGDGNTTGIGSFPNYLYGDWRPTNTAQTATFTIEFAQAGTASISLGTVNDGDNTPFTITVNGTAQNFNVSTGGVVTANVPAGNNTITFDYGGNDWAAINNFSFDGVGAYRAEVYGYKGDENIFAYLNDKSYGNWSAGNIVTNIDNVILPIKNMAAGDYQISYFDPKNTSTPLMVRYDQLNWRFISHYYSFFQQRHCSKSTIN